MKHLFQSLLLLMALLLPATATAYDFEVDGIYYLKNGTKVTVTYKGNNSWSYNNTYSGTVIIPTTVTYGGTTYSVTSIGDNAFYHCCDLTSVIIPNSVTTIGNYAFSSCSGLTSVIIPNSVTTIGDNAFYGCSGLSSVTIPNSVTSIGYCALYGCSGLTSITVASGNSSYDSRNNCNAIIETESNRLIAGCQNTVIPYSVTSIGNYAFYGCSGLTSVTIPNSVTTIGGGAFSGCSGLTSISVSAGNSKYDSRNNCNAIIETESNRLIAGCQNTVIPNSVTSIGDDAFYGCNGLTSVTIPNSVNSIGYTAFSGCSGLTSVTIPKSVTHIGFEAFRKCESLDTLNYNAVSCYLDYDDMGGELLLHSKILLL